MKAGSPVPQRSRRTDLIADASILARSCAPSCLASPGWMPPQARCLSRGLSRIRLRHQRHAAIRFPFIDLTGLPDHQDARRWVRTRPASPSIRRRTRCTSSTPSRITSRLSTPSSTRSSPPSACIVRRISFRFPTTASADTSPTPAQPMCPLSISTPRKVIANIRVGGARRAGAGFARRQDGSSFESCRWHHLHHRHRTSWQCARRCPSATQPEDLAILPDSSKVFVACTGSFAGRGCRIEKGRRDERSPAHAARSRQDTDATCPETRWRRDLRLQLRLIQHLGDRNHRQRSRPDVPHR